MNAFILSMVLFISTAMAGEIKFAKKWIEGDKHVSDVLFDGERQIQIWKNGTNKEHESPHILYKEGFVKVYKEFNDLSKRYNSCVEGKKWPESKECLKFFTYCFGKHQSPCDVSREMNRDKRCKIDMNLGECLQKSEAQLNYLKNCFDEKSNIDFSFLPLDEEEKWKKAVGIRSVGGGYNEKESYSCTFTYLDGEFHLVEIGSVLWDPPGVARPYNRNKK